MYMNKYPLLLKPVIKDYIWGGTRLKTDFQFETDMEIAAEGWVLSCHKDGTNTVINGEYAGKSFQEVLNLWGYTDKFPILIKLIDAKDRLSVQVHPSDAYALQNEGEFGKTEMWYIVDCVDGAQLAYGFKREISKDEFEQRIRDNTLDAVINYVPVKKGDVFFIEAGTLHAIGAGILIAEIQQNSNTTYRVSDYGRLGADGKPRALHVEKALDVTVTAPPNMPYGNVGKVQEFTYGKERELGQCAYFNTKMLELNGIKTIENENSGVSLLILSGEAVIKYATDELVARKGDSVFIPEKCLCSVAGNAGIIVTTY